MIQPTGRGALAVLCCWAVILISPRVDGFVSNSPFAGTSPVTARSSFSREQTILDIGKSRSQLKNLEWKKPTDDQVNNWLRKYGEVSRYYRRDVFTPGDWVRSRRRTRIFENLRSTLKSGLIRQISLEVSVLAAVSLFVILYNRYLGGKYSYIPKVLQLPLVPFNLAAASLGLMLSFRTNVSYQRWNEARTNWGKIINDSRSLARMGCIWGRSYKNADPTLLQRFGEAICSFSRSVMNRTLPSQEDEKGFRLYCYQRLAKTNSKYADLLVNANHRPTAALAEISSIMVEMQLHPLHQVEVEGRISELCNSLGACERILTSPVPTFYPRHTTRFLAVWLLFLPMALHDILTGWNHFIMVPVMVVLSGFLLGIEELANQMEEPFSILPQEKMCEGSIRGPVMEQVKRSLEWRQSKYYGYNFNNNSNRKAPPAAGKNTNKVPVNENNKEVRYTTNEGVLFPNHNGRASFVNGAMYGENAVNGDTTMVNGVVNGRQQPQSTAGFSGGANSAAVAAMNARANSQIRNERSAPSLPPPPPPPPPQSSGGSPMMGDPGFFDI